MRKPIFVVDWDGTCTEDDHWPVLGPWMPGAVDGLRQLANIGTVIIDSCRVNPYAYGKDGIELRPKHETEAAIAEIRTMLDDAGLPDVKIHTTHGKPPADEYIDNKGRRYHGREDSWGNLAAILVAMYGPQVRVIE